MSAHGVAVVLVIANGLLVLINLWNWYRTVAMRRFYAHLIEDWMIANKAASAVVGSAQKNQT